MWLDVLFGYIAVVETVTETAGVWLPVAGAAGLVWGVLPRGAGRPDVSGQGPDEWADIDAEESA